ncbi:uncharacterized protein [Palaemon carinicauda]|uniref:uncharacterized protein isoform X2 n=1 Tax=Palaemon carinicauda TaxID=392227 RepID=UPI0035B61163
MMINSDVAPYLHITRMSVPETMTTEQPTWLECDYAGDDTVYALKWYLGLDEFYRWTPADKPPKKTFEIHHNPIEVDLESSEKGRVRVRRLSLEATGVYRCEISAEAPSFHTESKISSMTVIDLPDAKPLITGVQTSYNLHEEVRLNCTSPLSYPLANITFYVNDEQADPSWLIPYKSIDDYSSHLRTAILGLKFMLWPHLLKKGSVSIKCTAEINPIYWENSETLIEVDIPYHASVMEGRASSADGLLLTTSCGISASAAAVASFVYLVL